MEDATRRTQHKPRRWGTVIKRKDDDGNIIAYVARYVNPLDKSKKIGKQFKPEYEGSTKSITWSYCTKKASNNGSHPPNEARNKETIP